ncbi:SDR family NAD(P)-dependent oxidoreductase [Meridianimarinicoccus aquatilis]|uniref:SDR family oxidoreductase n=1 Tax=Meridianimarinicoccus aquatilis TaxID=2552766 RepID=A0A4R6AJT9_9RHOB|nr:SDR family oxidoreductase [Fluviibacterium aquatile]QIE42697.1 SDR family oxidoreductase [Rhodobacteraceae bacterium SC52]TDL83817.1 SDR family oxidoreductase [Fluviibacterium aquatile]
MSFSVEGKTAIVTGAAHGIGLAIARHLLEAGANVMFADIDEARLKEELSDEADNDHAAYFAGDLRERLTLANLMSATIEKFDRLDILVNASRQVVATDPDHLLDLDETVSQQLEQNLMIALRLSQLAAKRMIAQSVEDQDSETDMSPSRPAGSIINLSSIAARRTHPQLLAFSVSTAALDQLTRSLAVALAPSRIRVNAVAFGSVMSSSLKDKLKENRSFRSDIVDHTPMSRIARPTEVTETVQFLASEGAGFMTGQILTVDGGRTLLDPVNAPAH